MAALSPELLLSRARGGDRDALGQLLELYRNYLMLIARGQLGPGLRMRLGASDLVQETFLEAHRDFPRFEGATEADLLAWLRRILVRNAVDELKRTLASRRDRRREESLDRLLEDSAAAAHEALAAGISGPSTRLLSPMRGFSR